jgi:hypothetical protein
VDYKDLIILAALVLLMHITRKRLARLPDIDAMQSDDLKRVLRWTQFWSVVGGVIIGSAFWLIPLSGTGYLPRWVSSAVFFLPLVFVGALCIDLGSHPMLRHWVQPKS